jgi:hypothetical protein
VNWALWVIAVSACLAAGILWPHLRGPSLARVLREPGPAAPRQGAPGGDSSAFGAVARGGQAAVMRDPWGRPL